MIARVFFLFLCGLIFAHLGYAQKLPKVKKLNMKVHFNITSDTLTMRFHRPNQSIKLEGFILGYGSNYFTNQYIQWPDNGKAFVTDVDAETRYLIAVKPNDNPKKGCKEKNSSQKPLQVVIGTLTPTSVFLSWGILINPQVDWSALSKCPNDRFYTVRYREKNKDWNFQLCPTTETVIDNLRPNTMYEFGVKDNNDEIWGTPQNHKTTPKGKENGNMENTYKIPKGTLQYASEDTKALIPVIVVKQGFQNITRSTAALPPTVQSPVLREVTKKPPLTTTRPSTPKPKPVSKVTDSPPTPKASEKIIVEDPKPVPLETQKIYHRKEHSTVGPTPQIDLKPSRLFPTDIIRSDIFVPKIPLVPGKTEKEVSSKYDKTSPPTTAVPKPAQTPRMPINLIRLHIFSDPALPSVESEIQTTVPPTPKTTQPNTIPQTKAVQSEIQTTVPPTLKTTQAIKIPQTKPVPNTTLSPTQSTTTQRPDSPSTTPVPVQKVSKPITQKPKPTPRTRTKPVTTAAPKETTTFPKIPHVTVAATLATYRVHHSSSRPRTSIRPRTRPAQNGTTQGSIRPKPTGDINWASGTIPGGRVLDSTKLLGVSRNISMESNKTEKRTISVSSPPLSPVKPTSIRKRIQHSNVTGRPGVTVSAPPLPPVKPTTTRRRLPNNGTAKPAPVGDILIPRAPSASKPNCTVVYIKPPKVQPTFPATYEDFVDPTVFNPSPKSEIDAMGKPRFTAPHVVYIEKEDNVPCSITESLKHFTSEEGGNQEVSTPPQNPPSNLTVVTVEGCPSFVILDWKMPNNDTATEFTIISTENGAPEGKNQSIITTNQTYSTVENLKPDTKYDFKVVPTNPLGEGPVSATVEFNTESADPRVSEQASGGKDAIWTEIKFKSDSYSECRGKQYVKRTWYKKFVGIQLCNSLRYKIYLSNSLTGTFYNIGDQSGYGEDHCQFVDSFLDGRTGQQLLSDQLTTRKGFYRSVRQQPVEFGDIGGRTRTNYVHWYECGIAIPGKW